MAARLQTLDITIAAMRQFQMLQRPAPEGSIMRIAFDGVDKRPCS